MDKKYFLPVLLVVALFAVPGCTNLLPKSGPDKWGKAYVKRSAMERYLEENELNTSYMLASAVGHLAKGMRFRERVRDQRGRYTLATVWIDASEPDMLHIQTMRTGDCPDCGGTGTSRSGLNLSVDFMCRRCKGNGKIDNLVLEKRYVLTDYELEKPLVSRVSLNRPARLENQAAKPLNKEERRYIDGIASKNPQERIESIKWLDTYYVRLGVFFSRLEPMLRKAIWQETDQKRNIRIYQFKAGGTADAAKAYYRLFVDMNDGKIIKKTFVSLADSRKNPYHEEGGAGNAVTGQVDSVKNWFTEGW